MGEIEKLEFEKVKLEESFNNPDLSGEEITENSKKLGEIKDKIEERELRWIELSEKLEA